MSALVVYESIYGNTRAIAEAIAEQLGAEALPVQEARSSLGGVELLVVGGPTHMHGVSTTLSRRGAVDTAHREGQHTEPQAAGEPGLREWIHALVPVEGAVAAAFDTRVDRSPWVTGLASRGIAKRLRRRGFAVISSASFLVSANEGPLDEGELERARTWGAQLARRISAAVPAGN